jgi:hypothetical protein
LRAEQFASRGRETSFIDGGDEGAKLIEGNAIQHETPGDPSAKPMGRNEIYRVSLSRSKGPKRRRWFMSLNRRKTGVILQGVGCRR